MTLEATQGTEWTEAYVAPPVGESDIRRWAIAVHWPETPPVRFTDPDYVEPSGHRGVIAPPDFNPFTWLLTPKPGVPGADRSDFPEHPRVMNGGQSDRYGAPIRPGDVIASQSRIVSIKSRETRLGDTRFIVTEERWLNQRGELVRTRFQTIIRY